MAVAPPLVVRLLATVSTTCFLPTPGREVIGENPPDELHWSEPWARSVPSTRHGGPDSAREATLYLGSLRIGFDSRSAPFHQGGVAFPRVGSDPSAVHALHVLADACYAARTGGEAWLFGAGRV